MDEVTAAWGSWEPRVRDDPFPLFAETRAAGPVHHVRLADGHRAWLVVGHAAARQALNDRRLSKDLAAALADDPEVAAEGLPGPAFAHHMLNLDPPDHTRLRQLVAGAFVPSRMAALEGPVRGIAGDLLDELQRCPAGSTVDLVERYALTLPFRVIGVLLGIPDADRDQLQQWFRTLLSPWTGDPPAEVIAASDAIVAYLEALVDAKLTTPADDLVSMLAAASSAGDQLSHRELLSTLFQLIVAGHDTTTTLIGNAVVALLDHPTQLADLRADADLLPAAVEELTRFTAPVPHATFRVTTEPVDADGVTIPSGQQVLVCLAAANHDPAHIPDPQRLDLRRHPRQHLGFGLGIHYCLGAPLARLEARIALGDLLQRFPDLRLAVPRSELAWTHGDGLVLRGLGTLPVKLGAGASTS